MKNYIYVLFNTLSKRYESVMSFPSDSMALHRLGTNIDIKEYTLCRVGSIDISTGSCTFEGVTQLIWSDTDLPVSENK